MSLINNVRDYADAHSNYSGTKMRDDGKLEVHFEVENSIEHVELEHVKNSIGKFLDNNKAKYPVQHKELIVEYLSDMAMKSMEFSSNKGYLLIDETGKRQVFLLSVADKTINKYLYSNPVDIEDPRQINKDFDNFKGITTAIYQENLDKILDYKITIKLQDEAINERVEQIIAENSEEQFALRSALDQLQKEGLNLLAQDKNGNTLLHKVVDPSSTMYNPELANWLVDAKGLNVNLQNKRGETAAHVACMADVDVHKDTLTKHKVLINDLMTRGTDPNIEDQHERSILTTFTSSLGNASKDKEISNYVSDTTRILVEHGARVNKLDFHNMTPLMYLADRKHSYNEAMMYLVEKGTDLSIKSNWTYINPHNPKDDKSDMTATALTMLNQNTEAKKAIMEAKNNVSQPDIEQKQEAAPVRVSLSEIGQFRDSRGFTKPKNN